MYDELLLLLLYELELPAPLRVEGDVALLLYDELPLPEGEVATGLR